MFGRIRENLRDDDAKFDDDTQVDETYVGGKTKRNRGGQERSLKQKTPVFGLVSNGKVNDVQKNYLHETVVHHLD